MLVPSFNYLSEIAIFADCMLAIDITLIGLPVYYFIRRQQEKTPESV